MADNVLNSEQYKLFQETSTFLTAAIMTTELSAIVSGEYYSKLNAEEELLLLPNLDDKYDTSLIVDGVNLISNQDLRPHLMFNFSPSTTTLTVDEIPAFIAGLPIDNASDYAKHFTNGVLNSLHMGLSGEVVSLPIIQKAFDTHTKNALAHKNLNGLTNYYLKKEVDDKDIKLDTKINNNYVTLDTNITNVKNTLTNRLDKHEVNVAAHKNLNGLNNYYLKNEIDRKESALYSKITSEINAHNAPNNTDAHKKRFEEDERQININTISLNNLTGKYNQAHGDDSTKQLDSHKFLAKKTDTELNGTNFLINNKSTGSKNVTIKVFGPDVSTEFTLDNNKNVNINVSNGGRFNIQHKGNTIVEINSDVINLNKETYVPNIHTTKKDSNSGRNTPLSNIGDIIPNTAWVNEWVKKYIDNNKQLWFEEWCKTYHHDPFGSMPDWSRIVAIPFADDSGRGFSRPIKVNVPGYFTIHCEHCSDADLVLLASYEEKIFADYLSNDSNLRTEACKKCIKLAEAFGYADREQSHFMVPIYPGTQTWVLPVFDNVGGTWARNKWVFVPALYVSQFTTDRSQYLDQTSKVIRYGNFHPGKSVGISRQTVMSEVETRIKHLYPKIFNYQNKPMIWLDNLKKK